MQYKVQRPCAVTRRRDMRRPADCALQVCKARIGWGKSNSIACILHALFKKASTDTAYSVVCKNIAAHSAHTSAHGTYANIRYHRRATLDRRLGLPLRSTAGLSASNKNNKKDPQLCHQKVSVSN
eukprot:6211490-Pleurochrysis_carterae.AAC.3